jgi:D-alanine-D-alanine ligase
VSQKKPSGTGSGDGRLRVGVLCGGRSAEHEISLLSARFVLESLDPERFVPVLVGIDKNGRWLAQKETRLLEAARDPRRVALDAGEPAVLLAPEPGAAEPLGVDVVFPVLHGPMGEDGTVQGLFELAGVPYVGSGVLGSAVGMDKDVMKRLLRAANLPVLPYAVVRSARWQAERSAVTRELAELGSPLFVKPANLGSSVGVTKVKRAEELAAAVEHAFSFDDKVVVEKGLERPREIECAVLGGEPPFVSVPGEIVVSHADGYYSYAAKYLDETGAVTKIPAELDPEKTALAQSLARATFVELGADDLARVDLFLDEAGALWVNEINTMPGFTAISMFPKLMEASGVPPRELVTRLVESALERARRKRSRSG